MLLFILLSFIIAASCKETIPITAPGVEMADWTVRSVVGDPVVTVARGQVYDWVLTGTGHKLAIHKTVNGVAAADRYIDGASPEQVTNAGTLEWTVPADAPDQLWYNCEFHPLMSGSILVADKVFTITAASFNDWTVDGVAGDAVLEVSRGETVIFDVRSITGHTFALHQSPGVTSVGDRFTNGTTGNGVTSTGQVYFTVPLTGPTTLYYNCELHSSMSGTINIVAATTGTPTMVGATSSPTVAPMSASPTLIVSSILMGLLSLLLH